MALHLFSPDRLKNKFILQLFQIGRDIYNLLSIYKAKGNFTLRELNMYHNNSLNPCYNKEIYKTNI
jgi:hypothetical protein